MRSANVISLITPFILFWLKNRAGIPTTGMDYVKQHRIGYVAIDETVLDESNTNGILY